MLLPEAKNMHLLHTNIVVNAQVRFYPKKPITPPLTILIESAIVHCVILRKLLRLC